MTINVGKNERNVEISNEPLKKSKSERSKFKSAVLSPTRLSAKERLGEKIEDEQKMANIKCVLEQRGNNKSGDTTPKTRSPVRRDRRLSVSLDNTPIIPNPERKVFVEDKKRDRSRIDNRPAEVRRTRAVIFNFVFFFCFVFFFGYLDMVQRIVYYLRFVFSFLFP